MLKGIILPALKTTWRKKSLWVLSLLTITPLTIGNEWNMFLTTFNAVIDPVVHYFELNALSAGLNQENITISLLGQTITNQSFEVITFILSLAIFSVVGLFITWIISNTQSVLILNASSKHRDQKLTLGEGLSLSTHVWKKVLALNVGFYVTRTLVIALGIAIYFAIAQTQLNLLFLLFLILIIIGLMLWGFVIRVGLIEIVVKNSTIKNALKKGMAVVKKNYGKCFELSFIIFITSVILLITTIALVSFIISGEQFIQSIISVLLLQDGFLTFIGGMIMLISLGLLNGSIALFGHAVWVQWYEDDTKPETFLYKLKKIIKREG